MKDDEGDQLDLGDVVIYRQDQSKNRDHIAVLADFSEGFLTFQNISDDEQYRVRPETINYIRKKNEFFE